MRALGLLAAALGLLWASARPASAQQASGSTLGPEAVPVFAGDGRVLSWDALLAAFAEADVVFLGELHDDSAGHVVKLRLLQDAHARYGEARPLGLALEMFETDVQLVLDEYLAGTIRERDFLAAARPWPGYARDYRPLVEVARTQGLPVLAANAPGRYVSLTSRMGPDALLGLEREALRTLPPLPVAPASPALAEAFRETMASFGENHAGSGQGMPSVEGMLAAQNLRDASMGHVLARHVEARPGALVFHVNGAFHSDFGRGVPEHLARYAPSARALTVSFVPETAWTEGLADRADFVVLTR